jgi:ABC-type multidrug transport system fused ATPase/permease subunit
VKLLARLYDPDQGSILFDGVDLRDLPRADLQRRIAFVFQGFGRYEATAADNIAYGDWQRLLGDRDGVAAVARTAGVDALIAGLPAGYDTHLGRLFGESDLSAGQWQKLAVARAFARQAALLILDEPTSNLDARAEHALFEQFRALAEGAPPSSCRTASRPSAWPSASSCSTRAASSRPAPTPSSSRAPVTTRCSTACTSAPACGRRAETMFMALLPPRDGAPA